MVTRLVMSSGKVLVKNKEMFCSCILSWSGFGLGFFVVFVVISLNIELSGKALSVLKSVDCYTKNLKVYHLFVKPISFYLISLAISKSQ